MTPVEIATITHNRMTSGVLSIWTIYYRPTDYPDGYIARRHEVLASGPLATDDTVKADDLWTLRKHFRQAGLSCINRHANDDAKIVESWL